jgi:rubrerythrin
MEDISNSNNVNTSSTTPPANTNTVQPEDMDSRWTRWKCLKCGYLYEGVKELKKCPKCGNENPDLFTDAD